MTLSIDDIKPDDPGVADILRGIKQATLTLPDLVQNGPASRTTIYHEIKNGRLIVARMGHVRFVTAIDYARWLLLMRRESEIDAKGVVQRTREKLDKARATRKRRQAKEAA